MTNPTIVHEGSSIKIDGLCCAGCTEMLKCMLVLPKNSTRCPACGEPLVDAGKLLKKIISSMERSVATAFGSRKLEKGL